MIVRNANKSALGSNTLTWLFIDQHAQWGFTYLLSMKNSEYLFHRKKTLNQIRPFQAAD